MKNSTNIKMLIYAMKKGYRVDDEGNIWYKHKQRKLCLSTMGYQTFTIRHDKVFRRVWVHQMQAFKKYNVQMLNPKMEVRHLDGNKLNNSYDNVLIGTRSENERDKKVEVRKEVATNASNKIRRFSDDIVIKIIQDRKLGLTYKDLCLKYETSKGTLSYLFNKSNYKNIAS